MASETVGAIAEDPLQGEATLHADLALVPAVETVSVIAGVRDLALVIARAGTQHDD